MADTTEIVDLYLRGFSIRHIADYAGVSYATARNRLIEARVITRAPRGGRRDGVFELGHDELVRLYHGQGLAIRDIASMFDVSLGTVRTRLVHHGIPRRRPGGRPAARRPAASDPDLPVGTEIVVHVAGRVVDARQGTLVLAVTLADGTESRLVVDLTAAGVSITRDSDIWTTGPDRSGGSRG